MTVAPPDRPTRPRLASLPEIHHSVRIPATAGALRKLLAFAGPGYLVAVGYMDQATGRPPWPAVQPTATPCSPWR
jgi:hypothetical protein